MGNRGPIRYRSKLGLGRKGVPELQAPSFPCLPWPHVCPHTTACYNHLAKEVFQDQGGLKAPCWPSQGRDRGHLGQGSGDGWGEIHPPGLDFHSGSLRNSEAVGRLCVSVCVSERE